MKTDTDTAAIQAIIEAIHSANHDKNAAAMAAHYTRDARIFDLAPPLENRGMDVAKLAAWFGTWEGPVERMTQDVDIVVSGDLALAVGLMRTTATTKQGGDHVVFWVRATIGLRRIDGTWTIVHEHTSVPFYMDGSFRAAADLEPEAR